MQAAADMISWFTSMLQMIPAAQEFYLMCFFLLGFILFRTKAVKQIIGQKSLTKWPSRNSPLTCSVEQFKALLFSKQYEEVLDNWPLLDEYTSEALCTVVNALLALSRPEDIGLFVAKAAANLPHLRTDLHLVISTILSPSSGKVDPLHIHMALKEVLEHNRDILDGQATDSLTGAFKRLQDDASVKQLANPANMKSQRSDVPAISSENQTRKSESMSKASQGLTTARDSLNDAALLRAKIQEGDLTGALKLFDDLQANGRFFDAASANSLLDLCVTADDRSSAQRVFKVMQESGRLDTVSFNILLKMHTGPGGSIDEVNSILQDMKDKGFQPNTASYNSVLSGAFQVGDLARAWQIIETMERQGPSIDAYTIALVFKGYKTQRSTMEAVDFDRALDLLNRYSIKVDEVLVNSILEACFNLRDNKRLHTVMTLFRRCGWVMPKRCNPNTCSVMLKAYGSTNQLQLALKLWDDVTQVQGMVPTEQMYAQLIDVLVTHGRFNDALQTFHDMRKTYPDKLQSSSFAVAFAMIIKGYTLQKDCVRAMQCYEEMKELGVTVGLVVLNTLTDACCRVGDMEAAGKLFQDMVSLDCKPDIITYSTLIKGYCLQGNLDKAMELFNTMRRKGIKPDAIVFNSLLDGCAKKEMPALCDQVVQDMVEAGVMPSNYTASILIKLYGRLHDLDAAFKVFDEMPVKYNFRPNLAVYTTLMFSCLWDGRVDLAMGLHQRMPQDGLSPDEKMYSTLLRGVIRAGNAEHVSTLMWEAIEAFEKSGQRLVDDELAQNALQTIYRRKSWQKEGGDDLVNRLLAMGYRVQTPSGGQEATSSARKGPRSNNMKVGDASRQSSRNSCMDLQQAHDLIHQIKAANRPATLEEIEQLLATREKLRQLKDLNSADELRASLRSSLGLDMYDKDKRWTCSDGREGMIPRWK